MARADAHAAGLRRIDTRMAVGVQRTDLCGRPRLIGLADRDVLALQTLEHARDVEPLAALGEEGSHRVPQEVWRVARVAELQLAAGGERIEGLLEVREAGHDVGLEVDRDRNEPTR